MTQTPRDPGPTLANVRRDRNDWLREHLVDCLREARNDFEEAIGENENAFINQFLGLGTVTAAGADYARNRSVTSGGILGGILLNYVVAVVATVPEAIVIHRSYEGDKKNCYSLYRPR
jgi:hypothetical protein